MIGKLTVDKASLNFSFFLKSIKIISDNDGKISRKEFVNQMSDFLGKNAVNNDGGENRTAYNKLKQVKYFGFSYVENDAEDSWLCLTPRGQILSAIIEEDDSRDRKSRYFVSPVNLNIVRKLFAYDILYNSYGRNNCGAEQSNTDTEPPKVIVKLLSEIEYASSEEICYAIYSLNGGSNGDDKIESWDNIKKNILQWRDVDHSYDNLFERWNLNNIVTDYKILKLLASPNVDVIKEDDGNYYLSNNLEEHFLDRYKSLNIYYSPVVEIVRSGNDAKTVMEWVQNMIVNRTEASTFLKICDIRNGKDIMDDIIQIVERSLSNNKTNYYLVTISDSKEKTFRSYGKFEQLIDRISDASQENNGESSKRVSGFPIAKFPANFHTLFVILDNLD